jgi:hypothetical protein
MAALDKALEAGKLDLNAYLRQVSFLCSAGCGAEAGHGAAAAGGGKTLAPAAADAVLRSPTLLAWCRSG